MEKGLVKVQATELARAKSLLSRMIDYKYAPNKHQWQRDIIKQMGGVICLGVLTLTLNDVIIEIVLIVIVEMKKERRAASSHEAKEHVKSRKELRKEKKVAKKERIKHYFKNQTHPTHNSQPQPKVSHKQQPQKKQEKVKKESKIQKMVKSAQLEEDEKLIKLYESKLGVKQGKDKYKKIAKNFGLDNDLFDFLDQISSKVTQPVNKKQQQQEEDINEEEIQDEEEFLEGHEEEEHLEEEEGLERQQNQDFDGQFDQMFDELGQEEAIEQQDEEEEQSQQQKQQPQEDVQAEQEMQQQPQEVNVPQEKPVYRNPFLKKGEQPISQQQKQVRRAMNALFNKLSDGNILLTFRQFLKLIESHPRSLTIPIYSELFTRFNLLIEKPLFHILATNVALAAALHYAFGNRLLAPVLHNLTRKYLELRGQGEDEQEVLEFGYSKRFERLKNYATIVSLLYNYGSITGDFLESLVLHLTKPMDKHSIELLYILVQKCGMKVRQNDPSTLKNIIAVIKESIASYRAEHSSGEQLQKVGFIQLELADIRFNKKAQAPDQRMAFLETFILKNVPKEIETEKEVLLLRFEELVAADTSRTNWWLKDSYASNQQEEKEEGVDADYSQLAGEKQKLLELARSFHMVTEVKKNIFLGLMSSKDYLEATQRILELRVKNLQDVAAVLVEVCTLQPSFNPYYPLVAAKLASVNPKFRLNLQYAIWDHLKLLHQYDLRRSSNLAKFAARLISDPLSNSSLSILKFYPDLSNIRAIDTTFLTIFFGHFFKKIKREYLSKLVGKLREDNNRSVKEGIKQFLSEFQPEPDVREKVQLCRRLLLLELDERKVERGDDD